MLTVRAAHRRGKLLRRIVLASIAAGDAETAGWAAAELARHIRNPTIQDVPYQRMGLPRGAIPDAAMPKAASVYPPQHPSPGYLHDAAIPCVRELVRERLAEHFEHALPASDACYGCVMCGGETFGWRAPGDVAMCGPCWAKIRPGYYRAMLAWWWRERRRRRHSCPGYLAWRREVEHPR